MSGSSSGTATGRAVTSSGTANSVPSISQGSRDEGRFSSTGADAYIDALRLDRAGQDTTRR